MSKELRICPGVGASKCGAFLARLDRDPHPTCTRCRGKVCTKDMTCDFCAVWSAEQWELFAKKRSYKERKHRPSGSAPSAQQTSPAAETSSGVSRPGTSSSSSSRPLGGQGKQGGSRGAPGVVSGGASSPPARSRSSERGGSASGHLSGVGGLASSSPLLSGGGGGEVARSRQTSLSRVSESVDSPSFSPHVPRRENARESSGSCSRAVSSRDSRSSVREPRKDTRARSREGGSRGRRRLSRSRSRSSPVRGQEVESGTGGLRPRHARLVVAHGESGRGLLTAIALDVEALGRGVPGPGPRTGTGHAVTALDVCGLGLLPVTAPAVSVRVPLLVGGGGAIVRDRTLPRVAPLTARGLGSGCLLLLLVRGKLEQRDESDVEPRRVWRRLPLSLLRFLEGRVMLLLLQEGLP